MRASIVFFQLLAHLGVGGFGALALVPGAQAARGFFRFSALLFAVLIGVALAVARPEHGGALAALAAAAGLGLAYAAVAPKATRAVGRGLLALAAVAGFAGAVVDAATGGTGGAAAATGALGAAAAGLSAALLGTVMAAMILGHWYLVMPGSPIDPLLRLTRAYFAAVVARIGVVVAALALVPAGSRALDRLLDGHAFFFWPRILFGLALPLMLALMALPTVRARDTQPATGMLYVATVLVLVGEGVAKYLSQVTAVPV